MRIFILSTILLAVSCGHRDNSHGKAVGEVFQDCPSCPEMVVLPSGSFVMGSPPTEQDRKGNEGPQRTVRIPQPFAVGRYEVTWDEYDTCVAAGSCAAAEGEYDYGKENQPVIYVSWDQATEYADWLSQETGFQYRLLTEAEWEYSARGGVAEADAASAPDPSVGNCFELFCKDGFEQTAPVGSFPPNGFGLHDMYGNVWEWVEDCYADDYTAGQPVDGSAYLFEGCDRRVFRGGSWMDSPTAFRPARRLRMFHTAADFAFGFRVARTL